MTHPLKQLSALGQSVWLDDLQRQYLQDSTIAGLVRDDRLAGLTSNPAIFERAIDSTDVYDTAIEKLARQGQSATDIYEHLVVEDLRDAADLLMSVYEESGGQDGYVCLEVSPYLANDSHATINEGEHLWARVNKPNLMIKVPGTRAGLAAIRALTAEGINVNVTLLFSPERYGEVADAYWSGLEDRLADGQSVKGIASVASFFLSRIDVKVDRILAQKGLANLQGTAAVTAAAHAYARYQERLRAPRWEKLRAAGAGTQRLLWASTGSKDPRYSELKYVEELIAPGTVTTLPLGTLLAFRDHGKAEPSLKRAIEEADQRSVALAAANIDMEGVAMELEHEGIEKFVVPFDKLMARIKQSCDQLLS